MFSLESGTEGKRTEKKAEICLLWQAMNIEGNIDCFLIQGGLHNYECDKHQILKIVNKITKYDNILLKHNAY